jgi:DNA-binding transcriptional LysR family regulator
VPKEVSWDALRLFLVVFRAGSFSAAADEIGAAQSSVSEQVARLETRLGYKLLIRSSAGVVPTDRGRELAASISDAVDGMAAAIDASAGQEGPVQKLVLGGPAEFLSEVALPHLAAEIGDEVYLSARFGLPENLLEDLRSGSVDLIVSSVVTRGDDLVSFPIWDEEFVLVGHPRWREESDRSLESIPVLAYSADLPIIRRYWRSVFGYRPSALRVGMIAPDLRTLCRLAEAGAGMTVLPEYLVAPGLSSGRLVALHEPEIPPLNTLYAVARRSHASVPVNARVLSTLSTLSRDR